eukprot:gene5105-10218_t
MVMILEISESGSNRYISMSFKEFLYDLRLQSLNIDEKIPSEPLYNLDENLSGSSYLRSLRIRCHDLHHLEESFASVKDSLILVRRHAVIVVIDPIRAVVTSNKLYLIVPEGGDQLMQILEDSIVSWKYPAKDIEYSSLPFEIRAYEAILITCLHMQRIDIMNMLTELLDNDEDMALMLLTKLRENPSLYTTFLPLDFIQSHEDIELIIEMYLSDFHTLDSQMDVLRADIENTDDSISLSLTNAQNRLLSVNIYLAVINCALCWGSFVGSSFGVNLISGYENTRQLFWVIFGCTTASIVLITWFCLTYLNMKGCLPTIVDA